MEAELDRMLKLEQLINDHLRDVNQVISPYHEEVALLAEGGLAVEAGGGGRDDHLAEPSLSHQVEK